MIRGEVCIGLATILSLVSTLLMIFMNVGQINTSLVPRSISMVNVNISAYSDAVAASIYPDPVEGLYTNNGSAPLGVGAGARQVYKFGLYSYCGYVNDTAGLCSNQTTGHPFQPFEAITSDMAANYSRITTQFTHGTTFQDSRYLETPTTVAYWMLLLGSVCAVLAFVTGLMKHSLTFFLSTLISIIGSILLLVGAAIWTVVIKKTDDINSLLQVTPQTTVPLGIVVSAGQGLYLAWAAFTCLLISSLPYMISCCTYR